jgi:chromosome segregation ATPase
MFSNLRSMHVSRVLQLRISEGAVAVVEAERAAYQERAAELKEEVEAACAFVQEARKQQRRAEARRAEIVQRRGDMDAARARLSGDREKLKEALEEAPNTVHLVRKHGPSGPPGG